MSPRPSRSVRPPRLLLGSLTAAAVLAAGLVAAPGPARSAPGESAACPEAYPATELVLGQEVTGLTTAGSYRRDGVEQDSRTTPEPFTGTYRGIVEDPAGDLLVFELEGSRITTSDGAVDAGVWAGISGSPLYATDGRLVGSVSYSFASSGATVFAGVTPAQDLYDLLDETAPAAPAARIVPDLAERRVLARQGVPTATTTPGATRLTPDVQIAGLGSRLSQRTLEAIAAKSGRALPRATGGGGTQAEEIPIVPGGNVAVADSYGSLALYSVGTAAAVCEDVVIGYGHAADWTPYTRTVHGASTVVIQPDGAMSFKMANLGAPMGTLLHDRLNGITGRLGPLPDGAGVTVTTDGPKPRATESTVPNVAALSFVVANQAYRDAALSLDELAAGTADVTWTIDFLREDGTPGSLTRSQRYASRGQYGLSIADEVPSGVAGDVEALLDNGFEDITITDVTIGQQVARGYRAYDLGLVEVRQSGAWKAVPRGGLVRVTPGKLLKVRVNLKRSAGATSVVPTSKVLSLTTSKYARGTGRVLIQAHGQSFWDDEEEWYVDDEYEVPAPRSFDQLLRMIAAEPRQDRVDLTLTSLARSGRVIVQKTGWNADAVVFGDHGLRVALR